MSRTIKIIHSCDHAISNNELTTTSKMVVRDANKDYDVVDTENVITEIFSASENDSVYYMPNVDFILFTHNKIKWVGLNRPADNISYSVNYEFNKHTVNQYEPEECPRCQGNGWYVGMFNNDNGRFSDVTDINKMVQDFIKILLTVKNGDLGTNITKIAGSPIINLQSSATQVASTIRDAESQYKNLQLKLITDGTPLSDDERLYKIDINDIEFKNETFGFIVSLTLYNYSGSSANANIKI